MQEACLQKIVVQLQKRLGAQIQNLVRYTQRKDPNPTKFHKQPELLQRLTLKKH